MRAHCLGVLVMLSACDGCGEGAGDSGAMVDGPVLELSPWVVDLGIVPTSSPEGVEFYAMSTGTEPVTILGIASSDPRLSIDPSWMLEDCDGDGVADCQELPAANSATDPEWSELLTLAFQGDSPDHVEAELVFTSTSILAHDFDEDGHGLTRLVVHVVVEDPCGRFLPAAADFVDVSPGETESQDVLVQNCGRLTLALEPLSLTGSDAFSSEFNLPLYVLPGDSEAVPVEFAPADADPAEGTLTLGTSSTRLDLPLSGNACPADEPDCRGADWSDDDGDGFSEAQGDCDDTDAQVHPAQDESHDDKDNDCDGEIDEGSYAGDDDGDGYRELDSPADCDDTNPWASPGATEVCDGRDNDCDGLVDEGDGGEADGACTLQSRRTE